MSGPSRSAPPSSDSQGVPPGGKLLSKSANDSVYTTFAAGHGFTVTAGGTGGDNLNDAAAGVLGAQGVTLVTDGAGTVKRLDKGSGLSIDLTNRSPVLWVMVEDTTHLNSLQVWYGKGGFGTTFRFAPWNSVSTDLRQETLRSGQWVRLAIPWGAQTLVNTFGTPSRADLDSIRIECSDDGTAPVTIHLGGVGAMPEPRAVWPHGVISFTFDDGYATQYTVAKPALDKYGYSGTAFLIRDLIGGAGNLTVAQARQMQDLSGWHIGCHADTVAQHNVTGGFPAVGAAGFETEVKNVLAWMRANGFEDPEYFAWPQGYFDAATLDVARRYFRAARSTISRTQETWPPVEPLALRVRNLQSAVTVATVQGWIDDAYTNGYWLIIVNHDFAASPANGNQYPPASFQTIVDYAATKGIPVRTFREVMQARAQRHAESHAPGNVDDPYLFGGNAVTSAIETFPRDWATQGVTTAGGRVLLTYFTPPADKTITNLDLFTGGTAGAGLTLARMGLYSVAANGDLTLVAATLNDTAAFTVASTEYARALDAGGGLPTSYTLKRGQRYAFGVIIVGTTAPSFYGINPGVPALVNKTPRMAAKLDAQADLPTTIANGSLGLNSGRVWGYFT